MVTKKEITERETQLNLLERQAKSVVKMKIPQRRYGTRVTRTQQQAVLRQRQSGISALTSIRQERSQLQKTRNSLAAQEKAEKDYQRSLQIAQKYDRDWKRDTQQGLNMVGVKVVISQDVLTLLKKWG